MSLKYALALSAVSIAAHAQIGPTAQQCAIGNCSGNGAPVGRVGLNATFVYSDTSQSPAVQYRADNGGWTLVPNSGGYATLPANIKVVGTDANGNAVNRTLGATDVGALPSTGGIATGPISSAVRIGSRNMAEPTKAIGARAAANQLNGPNMGAELTRCIGAAKAGMGSSCDATQFGGSVQGINTPYAAYTLDQTLGIGADLSVAGATNAFRLNLHLPHAAYWNVTPAGATSTTNAITVNDGSVFEGEGAPGLGNQMKLYGTPGESLASIVSTDPVNQAYWRIGGFNASDAGATVGATVMAINGFDGAEAHDIYADNSSGGTAFFAGSLCCGALLKDIRTFSAGTVNDGIPFSMYGSTGTTVIGLTANVPSNATNWNKANITFNPVAPPGGYPNGNGGKNANNLFLSAYAEGPGSAPVVDNNGSWVPNTAPLFFGGDLCTQTYGRLPFSNPAQPYLIAVGVCPGHANYISQFGSDNIGIHSPNEDIQANFAEGKRAGQVTAGKTVWTPVAGNWYRIYLGNWLTGRVEFHTGGTSAGGGNLALIDAWMHAGNYNTPPELMVVGNNIDYSTATQTIDKVAVRSVANDFGQHELWVHVAAVTGPVTAVFHGQGFDEASIIAAPVASATGPVLVSTAGTPQPYKLWTAPPPTDVLRKIQPAISTPDFLRGGGVELNYTDADGKVTGTLGVSSQNTDVSGHLALSAGLTVTRSFDGYMVGAPSCFVTDEGTGLGAAVTYSGTAGQNNWSATWTFASGTANDRITYLCAVPVR